ncbi:MAG: exopolysaccharide biosynthesis polyprenyl glycosylphosphotransferase [Bacteroidales bacterium]|nr:exopolysaccharide biosynthesis polyprenyl glycosylphosphotransferase [Bacteroidales bacterium]
MPNTPKEWREFLFYKLPTMLADIAILYLVMRLLAEYLLWSGVPYPYERYFTVGIFALLLVSYLIVIWGLLPLRLTDRRRDLVSIFDRGVGQAFLTWAIFSGMVSLVYKYEVSLRLSIGQLFLSMILLGIWHLLCAYFIRTARVSGRNTRSLVFVGYDDNQQQIIRSVLGYDDTSGYKVGGIFADVDASVLPEGAKLLGPVADAPDYLEKKDSADFIFCAVDPADNPALVGRLISISEQHLIKFYYVPQFKGYVRNKMEITQFDGVNVISLHDEPMNNVAAKLLKRACDVVISGLFLCTVYPFVWIFCAIGIKRADPSGPILFRQRRTGYNGREFDCLKFRSMRASSDADTKQAVEGDSRVFPFGEFLRRSSIDELPQFINVFKGDMSIIGPRPHMLHHTEIYSELIGNYMVRHLVKPGITGWAQVNGSRGETRTVEDMRDRVEKDIWYIENWSPELDVRIFFMTVSQLMRKDDKAY